MNLVQELPPSYHAGAIVKDLRFQLKTLSRGVQNMKMASDLIVNPLWYQYCYANW